MDHYRYETGPEQKPPMCSIFQAALGVYYLGQEYDGIYLYGSSQGGVDNIAVLPRFMFKYPASVGDSYQTGITIGGKKHSLPLPGN